MCNVCMNMKFLCFEPQIDQKRARKNTALISFTFLVKISHLHADIHLTAFCSYFSGFLYSNVVFLETRFYCGFDGIICFTIHSTIFLKCLNDKMNDTNRTAKISYFHKYYFQMEYDYCFLACCMRRLKGCPDGSASTA